MFADLMLNGPVVERSVERDTVARLFRSQFPPWAELELHPVDTAGWDNTTFRLGEHLSVRLPNHDALIGQVDKEQRWLPVIADRVTLPMSTPVGRWLPGQPAGSVLVEDVDQLAVDVAGFLAELQAIPIDDGPRPGVHNYYRGGPPAVFDRDCRDAIGLLAGRIDVHGALAVWDAAIDAGSESRPVWVHGDMTGSNLLIADGRLAAVIDFGCCAVGDPACDFGLAWTLFDGSNRRRFICAVTADDGDWARARGWTLWKAVKGLATYGDDHPRNDGTRLGWRCTSRQVVPRLIDDDRP
jgi:aminoglycoside phosphotransferase (APT) family kinase protein